MHIGQVSFRPLADVVIDEVPIDFRKDSEGTVYLTYSVYERGLDMFITAYHYLDIVPKGRDEDNLSFTMEWLRRHDEYDLQEVTMSITIVYDHFFMPGGDINEGKAAATELVEYSKAEMPEVELSLWLAGQENPLHHYHITVFSTGDVIQTMRECAAIKRFVDRLYPYMDLSTFISPVCGWFRCKNVHT